MSYLIAYIATAVVFLALDILWLGAVAKNFYFGRLDGLIREQPDLGVAGVFYVFYIAGVVFFAVAPALNGGGLGKALLYGTLLGLFAYGTYDATNLSTLKGWPKEVAIVDTLWGGFLTAASAGGGYLAASRFIN